MSAPKRGLGRGLGALLGEQPVHATGGGLVQIAVDRIRPNPQQPRRVFNPASLAELEQSIRELGVLVPIIVRAAAEPGVYELIAGERRWRAAAMAKLATIPAVVRTADDGASLELAVVENLQREDLDPLEEAAGFSHLIDEYGYTQERLAERLGKSRPAVANALRLLGLSDAVKVHVRSKVLSVGHARALLAAEPAAREQLAERAVREGLTVRDVERLATNPAKVRTVPQRREIAKDPHIDGAEGRLRYRLGARVAIVPGGRGGRIEIRYSDEADLMRIVDVMLSDGP